MKDHWTKDFNLEKFLRETQPKHVLEVGSLNGENTKNLMSVQDELGYKLTVISDDLEFTSSSSSISFMKGVSFLEFEKLDDNSIDLVIIDSDHNYWTVQKEMLALHTKLTENAWVIFHDVDTFYYDTGLADGYGVNSDYPAKEIEELGLKAGGLGMGILDFLTTNRFNYRLIRWIPEGNGVALIRKTPKQFPICVMKAAEGKGKRSCFV